MAENELAAEVVSGLAVRAGLELFHAYGVRLASAERPFADSEERLYSGVIGFLGRNLRGTCLLASHRGPLEACCPEGGALRDWIGELTNQLMGRLKSKLLAHDVEVALTTPIVLSGVKLEPLPRSRTRPTVLSAPSGAVLVWLELEADPAFFLGEERGGRSQPEGEVLLF